MSYLDWLCERLGHTRSQGIWEFHGALAEYRCMCGARLLNFALLPRGNVRPVASFAERSGARP